jgi:SAM-dependent methyltransferase
MTRGIILYRCEACDLVYSDPQPVDRVHAKYVSEYDLAVHFGQRAARKSVLFERRLARLGDPSPNRNRLCDVGSGDGQFLSLARDAGWSVMGIELNPPAAQACRDRALPVIEGNLEILQDLPWGTFDVVTAWDSLEHTPSPLRFAQRLELLAKPGGRIFLSTLNQRSLVARVFGLRWSMVVEDHFTYWSRKSLIGLVGRTGLIASDLSFSGIGRDFFAWLDRGEAPAGDDTCSESPHVGHTEVGEYPARSWDSIPWVLRIEQVANRILNATALGVSVELLATKPA